ncbi:hypothetical protein Q4489_06750 [Thalassotalea sp. 1_MG-2023]|nr:hypothetical protein [Thalassotalea sp. 1_MG-2023]MDO6426705.1 hypothetical protein [Thalassotalea sp. 1_MG-2023]
MSIFTTYSKVVMKEVMYSYSTGDVDGKQQTLASIKHSHMAIS